MKNLNDRILNSDWRDWIGTIKEKYIPDPHNFLRNKIYTEAFEKSLSVDEKIENEKNNFDRECEDENLQPL